MAIRTPGTKGFLLWVRENLPWVYAEYAKRGIVALTTPGLGAYNYSYLGDTTVDATDIGTATNYGDTAEFDSTAVQTPATPSAADPAASASASAMTTSQANVFQNIANAVGTYKLNQAQLAMQNKLLDAQLQQAQLGRPPLDLSAYGLGLPKPYTTPQPPAISQASLGWLVLLVGGGFVLSQLRGRPS